MIHMGDLSYFGTLTDGRLCLILAQPYVNAYGRNEPPRDRPKACMRQKCENRPRYRPGLE